MWYGFSPHVAWLCLRTKLGDGHLCSQRCHNHSKWSCIPVNVLVGKRSQLPSARYLPLLQDPSPPFSVLVDLQSSRTSDNVYLSKPGPRKKRESCIEKVICRTVGGGTLTVHWWPPHRVRCRGNALPSLISLSPTSVLPLEAREQGWWSLM